MIPVNESPETQEELRAHLSELLSQVKSKTLHEEIDFGIEGDEVI